MEAQFYQSTILHMSVKLLNLKNLEHTETASTPYNYRQMHWGNYDTLNQRSASRPHPPDTPFGLHDPMHSQAGLC